MALLSEYEKEVHSAPFLGYYKFFKNFKIIFFDRVRYNGRKPAFCYTDNYIHSDLEIYCMHGRDNCFGCMNVVCEHTQSDDSNNEICLNCWKNGGRNGYTYHGVKENTVKDLFEFTLYQRIWIKAELSKNRTLKKNKELKKECWKRIDFFLRKLGENFEEFPLLRGLRRYITIDRIREEAVQLLRG